MRKENMKLALIKLLKYQKLTINDVRHEDIGIITCQAMM